jgi:transposase
VSYNFRPVERDQEFLLPPSLRDWLPQDDLAWFVLDAVAMIDLGPIHARYRADGWGAPAFDPALMVALLLYAYATGERSSRRIEARCRRDIAYRVICANQTPDHATIARFRVDHEAALAHLFTEVLRLCAAAGLVRLGLLALDGTKIAAEAAISANRTADGLDAEIGRILAEAAATDAAEDAELGPGRRGDELPATLADRGSRLARLREARRQIDADEAARQGRYAERVAERQALEPAERVRVRPPTRPAARIAKGNAADPDSRPMKCQGAFLQGYNGQIVASESGVVVAAELAQVPSDAVLLGPMLSAAASSLAAAGISAPIGMLLADGGYWSEVEVAALPQGSPQLLIPPAVGRPRGDLPVRWDLPARDAMKARFEADAAKALYRRRAAIVEPLFGQLKDIRGVRRFRRRGLVACASEWKLLWATHNLLKLWRSGRAGGPSGPRSASSAHTAGAWPAAT